MVAVIDRSVLLRCLLALTLAALTAMPSFSSSLHQVKKGLKAAKGLKYRNFKARGYMCLMLLGASDDEAHSSHRRPLVKSPNEIAQFIEVSKL